jgi:hypothetical protein
MFLRIELLHLQVERGDSMMGPLQTADLEHCTKDRE